VETNRGKDNRVDKPQIWKTAKKNKWRDFRKKGERERSGYRVGGEGGSGLKH